MSTPEDYPEAEEEQPAEGKAWDDQGKPVNTVSGGDEESGEDDDVQPDEETEDDGGDEDDDVQPDEETDDGGGDEEVEKETSAG